MALEELQFENIDNKIKNEKDEIKLFKNAFMVFYIGQIFLIISTLSYLTSINGIPRFFNYFAYFSYVTYLMYFITLYIMRFSNKSFRLSYYSIGVFIVIYIIQAIASTSTNEVFLALSKGLEISLDIMLALFYLFFFRGTYLLYDKFGLEAGKRKAKIAFFVFLGIYILGQICEFLLGTRLLMSSMLAKRIFLYASWGLRFALYTFALVIAISGRRYLVKSVKEREVKEDGQQTK